MGGQTGFQSEAGKGSIFWFTAALPVQPSAQRPRALSLAGKRVLVVDAKAASRAVVKELLNYWHCDAEEAASAEEALGRMNDRIRATFDALIIDRGARRRRRNSSHREHLAAAIRQDGRHANTPIVLLAPIGHTVRSE